MNYPMPKRVEPKVKDPIKNDKFAQFLLSRNYHVIVITNGKETVL